MAEAMEEPLTPRGPCSARAKTRHHRPRRQQQPHRHRQPEGCRIHPPAPHSPNAGCHRQSSPRRRRRRRRQRSRCPWGDASERSAGRSPTGDPESTLCRGWGSYRSNESCTRWSNTSCKQAGRGEGGGVKPPWGGIEHFHRWHPRRSCSVPERLRFSTGGGGARVGGRMHLLCGPEGPLVSIHPERAGR